MPLPLFLHHIPPPFMQIPVLMKLQIAGPFFYKTNQSPTYSLGIWSMIVSHLLEVCTIITLWFLLSNENKRRDRVQSAEPGGLEGRDMDATAFGDLTDRENPKYAPLLPSFPTVQS